MATAFPQGFPRRGEIYWGPVDKTRPVVIVSADIGNQHTNAVVVAALTTTVPEKRYPVNVHLAANDPLPRAGTVLCRNLYTLLKDELGNYRDSLRPEQMVDVDRALAVALALPKRQAVG